MVPTASKAAAIRAAPPTKTWPALVSGSGPAAPARRLAAKASTARSPLRVSGPGLSRVAPTRNMAAAAAALLHLGVGHLDGQLERASLDGAVAEDGDDQHEAGDQLHQLQGPHPARLGSARAPPPRRRSR